MKSKTEAQKKAIEEKYDKEGEIEGKKEPRYDEEGGKEHKESKGYRTKEDSKEKAGKMDKEGRVKKCKHCGKEL